MSSGRLGRSIRARKSCFRMLSSWLGLDRIRPAAPLNDTFGYLFVGHADELVLMDIIPLPRKKILLSCIQSRNEAKWYSGIPYDYTSRYRRAAERSQASSRLDSTRTGGP